MNVTYYKRYRMEFDLRAAHGRHAVGPRSLPEGYHYIAWRTASEAREQLIASHAEVKHHSFRDEIDADVFACFSRPEACRLLMEQITGKSEFVPEATWLIVHRPSPSEPLTPCGTIQGVRATLRGSQTAIGAIQNVGVTPEHRSRGLGRALVDAALFGFQNIGLERAYLEVTASNVGAVELYRSIGFRRTKTLYKAVEAAWG